MIVLRTKHFGFFDKSGRLLDKYMEGGSGRKRFEIWKEGILNEYKQQLQQKGLKTDLSKKEINRILREQSESRDAAVNEWVNRRKELTSQMDLNSRRIDGHVKHLTELEKAGKLNHEEAEASKDFYRNELGGANEILDRNRRDISLEYLGLTRRQGRFAKFSPVNRRQAYDDNKIGEFIKSKEQQEHERVQNNIARRIERENNIKNSKVYKDLEQRTGEYETKNQKLQQDLNQRDQTIEELTGNNNSLNKQIADLTSQNTSHQSTITSLRNKNKTLEDDITNITNKHKQAVEEAQKREEGYLNDIADRDSTIEKKNKENTDITKSRDNWRYGAIGSGILGLGGVGYGIYNKNKSKE